MLSSDIMNPLQVKLILKQTSVLKRVDSVHVTVFVNLCTSLVRTANQQI